ncbi:hypothetical protein AMTR_s00042p00213520 [Amborella trichopoda]|uniref:Uncharacterized protein n=1 Tax=Amborella trichopoda TaxID=13333 RepID=W1P6Q9_AMBTC|nr:hypothetical protein AMTR_s00042p00213520 [Amborella trichopoda]
MHCRLCNAMWILPLEQRRVYIYCCATPCGCCCLYNTVHVLPLVKRLGHFRLCNAVRVLPFVQHRACVAACATLCAYCCLCNVVRVTPPVMPLVQS